MEKKQPPNLVDRRVGATIDLPEPWVEAVSDARVPDEFAHLDDEMEYTSENGQAIDDPAWEAERAALDRKYEDALSAGVARAPSTLPAEAREEEFLAEAIRITRGR